MTEGGKKFDMGKPDLSLLPYEALEEVAKVLMFGANKYGKNQWRGGFDYTRLISAAMRHMHQLNNGEDVDAESGISHAAHVIANMMFLLWMIRNQKGKDDRWMPNSKRS